jgi:hypothetical protein
VQLRRALEETATGALRRMASAHGLAYDDSTTRSELIERLAQRLTSAEFLTSALAALADDERAVLALARANDAGEVRGMIAERDYPGAADALAERGLLFRVFAAVGPLRGEVFKAPDELLALLPEPSPVAGPPLVDPPPAAERRASDPTFSLFCIASTLDRRGASLEADVRAWSEEPGGWAWDARWTFLRHLAEAAGLIVHHADGSVGAGQALARLLDDPTALHERLWRAYLRDRGLAELAQLGVADGAELASPVPLRAALIEAVEELPIGVWLSVASVADWLQRTRPNVVREQLAPRGLILAESLGWAQLETPLLRYVLLGPLYWLGVVGASADGTRITRRAPSEPRAAEACTWAGAAAPATPAASSSPAAADVAGSAAASFGQASSAASGRVADADVASSAAASSAGANSAAAGRIAGADVAGPAAARSAAATSAAASSVGAGRAAGADVAPRATAADVAGRAAADADVAGPGADTDAAGRVAGADVAPGAAADADAAGAAAADVAGRAADAAGAGRGAEVVGAAAGGDVARGPGGDLAGGTRAAADDPGGGGAPGERRPGPLELLAPPRAALGTLLEAERYLVLRERGRPSRYHLVQAHVGAALGGGGSLAECRTLLTRLTQAALPHSVADRLAAWDRRFGSLNVRPAVLLEARGSDELDAVLADEAARRFVRARLSPTVAEVAAADALELAAALRDADHLPRVDAALRLSSDARRAYAGLVDEQVLEFLLVSLLAFSLNRPERLAELEGSQTLLERLERQFPPERLRELRTAAARLAGELGSAPASTARPRKKPRRRRQ